MSRRLLLGYLSLTLFVLVVLMVPLGIADRRNERQDLTAKVERDAVAMASLAEDTLEGRAGASRAALAGIAARYQARTGGRVVITDARGVALVDTRPTAPGDRFFASRPEIAAALSGRVATGVRHSNTLRADLLYVAVPAASGGRVHGAVRITYPTSAIDARVHRYWLVLLAIAAIVLAAASFAGLLIARWITRPLGKLEQAAAAAGGGDLSARAPVDSGPPEVKALAAGFNDMVARLEELIHSQEAFVADASHQLRTPLTALRLRLENLERDVAQPGRDDLESALAEVARLSRLVDGLLALARADRAPAALEDVAVGAAVGERLAAWSPLAAERDVRLERAVDDGLAVRATPGRVEQVLDNLLANALEVAPRGSAVTVAARSAGAWVELHVIDRGPGMSAEERARAFDRFWQASAGTGGSGLGLAIVRRLVAADGGEVALEPADGGGLDAVVRLLSAPRR